MIGPIQNPYCTAGVWMTIPNPDHNCCIQGSKFSPYQPHNCTCHLFLFLKADLRRSNCDKTFSGSFGTIVSPDYNSKSSYAANQICQFDIRVSSGSLIKLEWSTFDIKGVMPSCANDYVEIYIGCSRNSIGRYCSDNSGKPHGIYSPDNCLRIKFRSDSSGSGKGFKASYSTIRSYSSYVPGVYSSCYSEYLSTKLYSKTGVISSPRWPSDYPNFRDCYWRIDVGKKNSIKIAFMDFDLEDDRVCNDDKVKVKGGNDYQSYDSSSTVKSSMCGKKTPFSLTSSRERIWIRFKSDSFHTKRGFVAGYVIYQDSGKSSSSTSKVVTGIVVGIIVLLVFAGCIYYVFVYRKRLAMRQASTQHHVMTTGTEVHVQHTAVHHPPPPPQPGYGPPPPTGYGAPPPPGNVPSPGYAPPPYSQVVGAPYPQPDKTGPYPPLQGGGAPYPPGQPVGVSPYPPAQPGGAPAYPMAPPHPAAAPGGSTPYPSAPFGGSAPYPSAPPGDAPYPPKQ